MKEKQPVWKRTAQLQVFCKGKEIISIQFYYDVWGKKYAIYVF